MCRRWRTRPFWISWANRADLARCDGVTPWQQQTAHPMRMRRFFMCSFCSGARRDIVARTTPIADATPF